MDQAEQQAINDAGAEVRQVIGDLIIDLQTARASDGKFFPNGIELIDVEVSIGAKDKPLFSVKAKVAGPKPPPLVDAGDAAATGD